MAYTLRFGAGLLLGGLFVAFSSCGGPADTPDGAIEDLFDGLAKDDPGVVWEMMPPSYQEDVEKLLAKAGEKIPEELYDQTMDVVRKAVDVFDQKKDLFLESPLVSELPVDKKVLGEKWSDAMGVLDTLLDSELGEHSSMKSMDVGDFLSETGGELMALIHDVAGENEGMEFPDFAGATIELASEEGDNAVVHVSFPDKPDRKDETKMVKVEGHWVLAEMAEDWKGMIESANQQLDSMPFGDENMVKGLMAKLKQADGVLDEAMAAQDLNAFMAAIAKLQQGM